VEELAANVQVGVECRLDGGELRRVNKGGASDGVGQRGEPIEL
jgi:hypothetical protein